MASYDDGKREIAAWIEEHFPLRSEILDVGACDGKWRWMLAQYPYMDAVEIWKPNAEKIAHAYRKMFPVDICLLEYDHYDLVIFGDILEHLSVERAQKALEYAKAHADAVLVAVPFWYEQDAMGGNVFEVHVQPDLTPEVFAERYPGFEVLLRAKEDYCYYIWQKDKK